MNLKILNKIQSYRQQHGTLRTIRRGVVKALKIIGFIREDPIYQRRLRISQQIAAQFKSTVAYGPFTGLKLIASSWWGQTDKASMLFDLYEKEILETLQDLPAHFDHFIDLGAADGYYGVGVLVSGRFQKSICYEESPEGMATIADNAKLNGVSDRITIRGYAERNFYDAIPPEIRARSVMLMDIEGGRI